tara:strand:- start:1733 stop:3352 length:1620 start_codon:yes stop_codon:yes gene_type:complete
MATFKGFPADGYLKLSASLAAGTTNGFFTRKQRIPFSLKDPRGSKHEFYKRMKTKESAVINNISRPPIKVFNKIVDVGGGTLVSQSLVLDLIPSESYKSALNARLSSSMAESSYLQISASVFGNITFPSGGIVIMSTDNEDGFLTGSYIARIKSGSGFTFTPNRIGYSGIANKSGFVDFLIENSSSFNTGATWSFANTGSSNRSVTLMDGAGGNELHQFDATSSFMIRMFNTGSTSGSYILSHAGNVANEQFKTILHGTANTSGTASRIDAGANEYYEFSVPNPAHIGSGSFVSQSTARFNRTVVTANIFGDGDENQFTALFTSASANNTLFAADREFITFPSDTVAASGGFFFSETFETLVGVHNANISVARYKPIKRVTLYWASGSSGTKANSLYGLSGSISPSSLFPDSDSIKGAKSGSHIFLNKSLTMPASGGYYTLGLSNYPATLSDGNFQGGLPASGTIHVAGDGMRGTGVVGASYFLNTFRDAHAISQSIIGVTPRWNGISFSNLVGIPNNIGARTGFVEPGLSYVTGSGGD